MSRLEARVRPVQTLDERQTLEMFRLYDTHYAASSFELFRRDLAAKSHVIDLRAGGILRGFSTAEVLAFELEGVGSQAIFSGDTIVDPEFWGEQALVQAFCRYAGDIKACQPGRPLYWFLISKGYRTYRYLSLFAKDYYPHHAQPTPRAVQERLEHLARLKFGDAFDSATGLIRFPTSMGHLRAPLTCVRSHLLEHPAVAFFLERNPRYHAGEELACLTELSAANLRSFAKRAFAEGLHGIERDLAA